ncbi:MAG: glycosyltransferase family 2 protein [Armatimonadetes bacterium]|nr:glycosyltransferase family 2 protein [Armatimonadota bacterium]
MAEPSTEPGAPSDGSPCVLSVIVPAYNERKTIVEIVQRIRQAPVATQIVIVDDASNDGTTDVLRTEVDGRVSGVTVCYHERNMGKGSAIRTAIPKCTGDFIVIQDADLEYDPNEYPLLLAPLLDGRADVVYGSRFLGGGPHRVHLFWHRLGNAILTTVSNMLTNLNLTDMEVCYKVFRADILRGLKLRCRRFDFEPEVTAKVARLKCRIYEVPVSYYGRDYAEGKKIGWRDGLIALWTILKCRFTD